MWGSCFWFCIPPPPPSPPPALLPTTCAPPDFTHTTCPHTQLNSHNLSSHNLLTHNSTHHLLTHNLLTHSTHTTCHHTTCSHKTQHTTYSHTQLAHTLNSHNPTHTTQLTQLNSHNLSSHNLLTHTSTHHLLTHNLLTHSTHTTCHHATCSHTTQHNPYSHTTCSHTTEFTQLVITQLNSHTTCPHTTCSHTQLVHTQLCHTPCPHTTCSTHNLSSHNLLTHNLSSHRLLTHNLSTKNLHLATRTFTLRGRRGTYGTGLALVARLGWIWRRGRRCCLRGRRGTWRHGLCVAGVALMALDSLWWHAWIGAGTPVLFAWQAAGKRGTWGHRASLCVASMAHTQLVHTQLITYNLSTHSLSTHNLSTQNLSSHNLLTHNLSTHNLSHTTCPRTTCPHATSHTTCHHTTCSHTTCPHTTCTWRRGPSWHLWHWTGSGGALGLDLAPWLFAWQARHLATSSVTLRGRRGTWRHGPQLCVAGVALMVLGWLWWRAWVGFGAVGRCLRGRRGTWRHLATSIVALRGRHGTWRHGPPLCVASVALMVLGWLWWRAWVGFGPVDGAAVCVAGVALGDIERRFAWQAWHLATWTSTLRGRRGTYGPGLALVARLGWIWRRGRCHCLRGRRGTWRHRATLCVAGMALGDMDLHFAWQAWHLWYWAGPGGALGLDLAPWTPPLFARQAWRLATSSVALRGRRSTWRHEPPLCVAGVALMALGWLWWRAWVGFGSVNAAAVCVASVALGDIERRFAWQAWHLATWTSTLRGRRGTYSTGLALVAHLG